MADLFWPGTHRAGDLLSGAAFVAAMVEVEQAWLAALASQGIGLAGGDRSQGTDLAALVTDADLDALAIESEAIGNPVMGLVALLRERSGNPWVHRGLTSQDVLDTALMLCLRDAVGAVADGLDAQIVAVSRLAETHRDTVMAGRTLGQHAVPITFGLKAATWLTGLLDARDAVASLRFDAQLGGAAGTLAAVRALVSDDAAVGALVTTTADALGLHARTPWHTARRPITAIGDALVTCTDAWGRIATDVATLSRPEIGELAEPAAPGRGASSTMPHKRNPILSVLLRRAAITAPGLASTLHLAASLAGDERPDGAWHAEWSTVRDLSQRAVVAASQATDLLTGLEVNASAMVDTASAAADDLHSEQAAIQRLSVHSGGDPGEQDAAYVGLADDLITRTLRRADISTEDTP